MDGLRRLGPTQQALLRHLLREPDGSSVEALCEALRISHNAVRQHLTALIAKGWVERAAPQATGGRPQARFRITASGRALFPRNYAGIASALLDALVARLGDASTRALLVELGHRLGAQDPIKNAGSEIEPAAALAERLARAGYEAIATQRGGAAQVEAFNCVFHAIARQHPDVCGFDLAFMEAASGRRIEHRECIVRGGRVCRFAVLPAATDGASLPRRDGGGDQPVATGSTAR